MENLFKKHPVSQTASVELTKFPILVVIVSNKTNETILARDLWQFALVEPLSSLESRIPVLRFVAINTRTAMDEKTTQEAEIHDEKQIHSDGDWRKKNKKKKNWKQDLHY